LNESERRILLALRGRERGIAELLKQFGLKSLSGSLKKALDDLGEKGLIEMTFLDRPNSKNQKRRLTPLGEQLVRRLTKATTS
jgi:hypothetical protein